MGKIIEHNLLPKQKPRKNNLKVKVDLYNCATELYNELSKIGIIQRLRDTTQLGVIKLELTYNNPIKAK